MLVNRVGDFFILLALFSIFYLFNSLDYEIVFNLIPEIIQDRIFIAGYHFFAIDLVSCFLFIGAMGKSAQLFLHT